MISGYTLEDAGGTAAISRPEIVHIGLAEIRAQSADDGSHGRTSFDLGVGNEGQIELDEIDHLVRWSPYIEQLFQELVEKRATRKITDRERTKLNWLRQERERIQSSLPPDQILRDFKAGELRRKALSALSEYAQFLKNTPDNSGTRPGRMLRR